MTRNAIRILAVVLCVGVTGAAMAQVETSTRSNWLFGSHVLANGDFERPSILGAGQTEIGAFDDMKLIETDSNSGFWGSAISGVQSWDNALAFGGPPPSRTDQGMASFEDIAGAPLEPRYVFINNWDRRFNQTVAISIEDGVTYTATIEFATRLDDPSQRRAGLFELRAGPMNPDDPDDPGTSILLDAKTVGQSGFYGGADPDVVVNDREFTMLTLNFAASGPGDPAIGRRVTLTFRTEWGSQGPTFWDNATLVVDGICDPCDMNCDGAVNAFDIEPFLDLLFGGGVPCDTCTGDVNGDGNIDAFDIEPFLNCLFP